MAIGETGGCAWMEEQPLGEDGKGQKQRKRPHVWGVARAQVSWMETSPHRVSLATLPRLCLLLPAGGNVALLFLL